MTKMFALIDGNSFYCACERIGNPALRGKPLVVLSNNDGCVIARSDEAKDLGLKMGDPWHIAAKRPGIAGVVLWQSSNYTLYADISRRFYQFLLNYFPVVEPYSIDEMFLDLTGLPGSLFDLCMKARNDLRRIVKVPTCVGIGPTKTIAKLANKYAKMDRGGCGVVDFSTAEKRLEAYRKLPVAEVWGMGRASVETLKSMGVETVAQFVALPLEQVRKVFTVTGLRTHAELRGISCIPLNFRPPTRKSIAVTRSFGRAVTDWKSMSQALATHASRAGEKLRTDNLYASAIRVFMHTNRFNGDRPYANQVTCPIEATNDTRDLIGIALRAGKSIWRPGFRFSKCGIEIIDLYQRQDLPTADLFPSRDPAKSASLMAAMDSINSRHGRGSLRSAATAPLAGWSMRRANLSPRFTTEISEIIKAKT